MDEAYHDFVPVAADYISFLATPIDEDRVIVARTFSKIYGMAGLRLGYAVTSAKNSKAMAAHKLEDSTNILALRAGLTSLDNDDEHKMAVMRNGFDRDEFQRQASQRKLQVIPSWTNFVMFNTQRPIRTVIDYFKKNNIRIGRPFPPMDTYARISLGQPDRDEGVLAGMGQDGGKQIAAAGETLRWWVNAPATVYALDGGSHAGSSLPKRRATKRIASVVPRVKRNPTKTATGM